MSRSFDFFSLLIFLVILAVVLKLTAVVYRRSHVKWIHCIIFVAFICLIVAIPIYLFPALLQSVSPAGGWIAGVLLLVVLGGGFFKGRAQTRDAVFFTFAQGATLAAMSVFILIAVVLCTLALTG